MQGIRNITCFHFGKKRTTYELLEALYKPFRATGISLRNQVLPTASRPLQFLGATKPSDTSAPLPNPPSLSPFAPQSFFSPTCHSGSKM